MTTLRLTDLLDEWLARGEDWGEPISGWARRFTTSARPAGAALRAGAARRPGAERFHPATEAPRAAAEPEDRERRPRRSKLPTGGSARAKQDTNAGSMSPIARPGSATARRIGEADTAAMLELVARGLTRLPSWHRAREAEILSAFEKTSPGYKLTDEDLADHGFLLNYPLAVVLSRRPDTQAAQEWLGEFARKHYRAYDSPTGDSSSPSSGSSTKMRSSKRSWSVSAEPNCPAGMARPGGDGVSGRLPLSRRWTSGPGSAPPPTSTCLASGRARVIGRGLAARSLRGRDPWFVETL